jgi:tryptophan synthase alpha chain
VISEAFRARRAEGQAALVPYVTAGYPGRDATVPVLEALAAAGADVIELGIPFSDPLADGPTIQKSSFDSLSNGTTVASVLRDVAVFRAAHATPVVLFTYLNPLLRYGLSAFIEDAVQAGANGLLVTDLPTGADLALESQVVGSPLDLIRLIAPTTEQARLTQVAQGGSGFIYYISRTGVTGAQSELRSSLAEEVRAVKTAVSLPVAVGFGVSTPAQAGTVARLADGVVVGSALVRILGDAGISAAADFLASLRAGMDQAPE